MARLNADYSLPASVRWSELSFVQSPSPAVTRGQLDRVGDEVARASTHVRYAPGSSFPAHTHGGGEEFLVLEGEFADEHGTYPVGTYIRNPVSSRHNPRVGSDGCLIFVKLRWMRGDEPYVLHEVESGKTRTDSPYKLEVKSPHLPVKLPEGEVEPKNVVTMYYSPKSMSGTERVRAVTLTKEHPTYEVPGSEVGKGGLEIVILRGTISFDGETWSKWDWIRRPSTFRNLKIELSGDSEAKLFLKTGYLEGWTDQV